MQTTQESLPRYSFKYTGTGGQMALLVLKNLFFTIFTLGFYSPWARTNMRRYVWGNVQFMEDRGSYTGKGEELFKGWFKLFGMIFCMAILVGILQKLIPAGLQPLAAFIMPLFYVFIISLAIYSGLRYRLSRTTWRQIRFGADKDKASTKEFTLIYFKGVFFTGLTLGLYYPFFKNNVRTYLTNKSRFGSEYFVYSGPNSEFFKLYFKGLFFSVITLGIYVPWFIRDLADFRLKHTRFQDARFTIDVKGGDIFKFALLGYLATFLTLGLAGPWIFTWGMKLFIENIHLEGHLDMSRIQQRESDGSAMADDFASAYELDLGF